MLLSFRRQMADNKLLLKSMDTTHFSINISAVVESYIPVPNPRFLTKMSPFGT